MMNSSASTRIRWRVLTDNFSLHFPSVEVPVATTSSTSKLFPCASHELPASIHSIPSNICCMVLLTLPISNVSRHWRWSVCHTSFHHNLSLLHDPHHKNPNPLDLSLSLYIYIWLDDVYLWICRIEALFWVPISTWKSDRWLDDGDYYSDTCSYIYIYKWVILLVTSPNPSVCEFVNGLFG